MFSFTSWRCGASIPVPLACKASALPFELHPHLHHPGLARMKILHATLTPMVLLTTLVYIININIFLYLFKRINKKL